MRHFRGHLHQGVMHAARSDRPPSPFDIDTQPYELQGGGDLYCPTCGDAFSPMCSVCPDDEVALVRPYDAHDALVGSVLDERYRIIRRLGEGAMGVVYQAVQLSMKRPVALKVIREELGRDLMVTRRFLREARVLIDIAHPNIVVVFDYGETDDGVLFLVMELLRGHTLDTVLAHRTRFSARQTCVIGAQLCDALTAAHSRGVVHRDLKPANIILEPGLPVGFGDTIKVLDFGLAKQLSDGATELTYTGAVIGTPMYMPPEAIRSDAPDPRSDLYALGCILYEMLTGAPPFEGDSSALVLARQLDDLPPPLPPDVPAELRKLVTRLLAKCPTARPATAGDVRDGLESCLASIAG